MDTIVIILAGGKGIRFGANKQFVSFNNIPLFIYTLKKFKDFTIVLTVPSKYVKHVNGVIKKFKITDVDVISGGITRQESVKKALLYIKEYYFDEGNVIITDANRPFISTKSINKCLNGLTKYKAVIAACKSINTACESINSELVNVYLRTNMYELLMPQCFDFATLIYSHINSRKIDTTDDTQIIKETFPEEKIHTVDIPFWEGLKLTHPEDYDIFNMLLRKELK